MIFSEKDWEKYIGRLRRVSDEAADKMVEFLHGHRDEDGLWNKPETRKSVIKYAHALSTKYGEAASALACEMYDAVAAASGASVPAAEPAETATFQEVAKAVNGTLKDTQKETEVGAAVGRRVKMVGVDTVMKNALRDGAEWAWVPHGDSCAFCIALASNGWQRATKKALKNGHADHIHAHCDCTYAVRFDKNTEVEGYDPEEYKRIYDEADGVGFSGKVNAIRRKNYSEKKGTRSYGGIPKSWINAGMKSSETALSGANPNYKNDIKGYLIGTIEDYTYNCANSVVAYEMRRRGYDVTACSIGENRKLRNDPFSAWVGGEPITTSGSGLQEILEYMGASEEGTRIEISVGFPESIFDNRVSGHAFVAEKREREVLFLDPQTGGKISQKVFQNVEKDATMFLRIDNLEISDRGVSACKKAIKK